VTALEARHAGKGGVRTALALEKAFGRLSEWATGRKHPFPAPGRRAAGAQRMGKSFVLLSSSFNRASRNRWSGSHTPGRPN